MLKVVRKLPQRYTRPQSLEKVLPAVRKIIAGVRRGGDGAVIRYAKQFDGVALKKLEIPSREVNSAAKKLDSRTMKALRKAAGRIRDFAKKQLASIKPVRHDKSGVSLEQRLVPVERAGIYVPGGRYPLASTALMGVIPAKVAGVKEVIVCTPNARPLTIAATKIAGADRIFNIGGVQAIAAMALGTRSVPRVDVIAGPGNVYVTAAKKELYGEVGIDFVAGPTELAVVADSSARVDFVAADVLAQAEHDPEAAVIVITDSADWAKRLNAELSVQLSDLPTASTAKKALRRNAILLVKRIADAADCVNDVAPEHCQVMTRDARRIAGKITNCGTLLVGPYSSCALSDYSTGANHILPTALAARYTAGLSVHNFIRFLTVQQVSRKGADEIAPIASELARLEGLAAHSRAAQLRTKP